MPYYASSEEHPIKVVNLESLETRAKNRMEPGAFGYIVGGAEDEWTLKENTLAFNHKKISPRLRLMFCRPLQPRSTNEFQLSLIAAFDAVNTPSKP